VVGVIDLRRRALSFHQFLLYRRHHPSGDDFPWHLIMFKNFNHTRDGGCYGYGDVAVDAFEE